jgi:hypothetical protein
MLLCDRAGDGLMAELGFSPVEGADVEFMVYLRACPPGRSQAGFVQAAACLAERSALRAMTSHDLGSMPSSAERAPSCGSKPFG